MIPIRPRLLSGPQLQAMMSAEGRSGWSLADGASAADVGGHELPGDGRRIASVPRLERVDWAAHGRPHIQSLGSAVINLEAGSPPRKLSQMRASAVKVEGRPQAWVLRPATDRVDRSGPAAKMLKSAPIKSGGQTQPAFCAAGGRAVVPLGKTQPALGAAGGRATVPLGIWDRP